MKGRVMIIRKNNEFKKCNKCKQEKLKIEFSKLSRNKDKLSTQCKSCLYKRLAVWNNENKESRRESKNKWKRENKEKMRKYERDRRSKDTDFKLKCNMRHRLTSSFKKTKTSIRHLEYSSEELKKHLESKFTKGMSWENYGKDGWEIDHIIPIVLFNINGDPLCKEFKACWSLKNLQPLWKNNKIAMEHGEDESYIGNCQKQHKLYSDKNIEKFIEEFNNV